LVSIKHEEAPESTRAKAGTEASLILMVMGRIMFSSFFGLLVDRELITDEIKAEIPG
jgi:hypothetical protein